MSWPEARDAFFSWETSKELYDCVTQKMAELWSIRQIKSLRLSLDIRGNPGTKYLSEFTFRFNDEVLKPIQEDFSMTIARIPKKARLSIRAYAAVYYTTGELEEIGNEEIVSNFEGLL